MANSDRKGRVGGAGKKWLADLVTVRQGVAVKAEHAANIVVGDFLSELLTVMRTRYKTGLREGDWIEDPERVYMDGAVFGEEVRVASEIKLQIALCVDVSKSTYFNGTAAIIGKAVVALDRMIRKAQAELPEGALSYRLFAFNRNTYVVGPDRVMELDTSAPSKERDGEVAETSAIHRWGTWYVKPEGGVKQSGLSFEQAASKRRGYFGMGVNCKMGYDNNWEDTLVTPLFEAIEAWEQTDGDPHAYRVDIILSDGEWDNYSDVQAATRVQERRNGRLTTFMLNFLPRWKWKQHALPQRCYQYEANREYLGQQIQQIVSDALLELA